MKHLKSMLVGAAILVAGVTTPSFAYVECTTKVTKIWVDGITSNTWVIFEDLNAGISQTAATTPAIIAAAMTAMTANMTVIARYNDGFACSNKVAAPLQGLWIVK
jgi:hypothetical protein